MTLGTVLLILEDKNSFRARCSGHSLFASDYADNDPDGRRTVLLNDLGPYAPALTRKPRPIVRGGRRGRTKFTFHACFTASSLRKVPILLTHLTFGERKSRLFTMPSRPMPFSNDQPTKRARAGDPSFDREISLLNQSGVLNMNSGLIDDAQHFFVKALDCFIAKQHGPNFVHPEVSQRNDFGGGAPTTSESSIRLESTSSLKAPSLSDTLEYDEKMRTYTEPMTLSGDVCDSMQSATLYYNVAQTFVSLRKYHEAMCWFELALMCINFIPPDDEISAAAVRIHHNLGYCFYRLAKSHEASYCFQKALDIADGAKLGSIYTSTARNGIAVLVFYSATPNTCALELFQESLVEYESLFGRESREVATILNNIGRVHYADGNYQGALCVYEEALAIRRKLLNGNSIDVAATICSTGQTLHHLGKLDSAIMVYQEFLALADSGKYNTRDVAIISKNLAEIYHKKNDLTKAKSLYEKALESGLAGFGHIHPEVASVFNRLGNLYFEANDLAKALECYKDGLTIEQLTLHACHDRIVVSISNIAQIHYQLEEFAVAMARYSQVHVIQLRVHGPGSLEVAKALSTMGEMEYKMGRFDEAFMLFQDVLVIQRDYFENSDGEGLEIASTMNSIGIVACAQGEFTVAQSCFTSSLNIRQKELGDHKDTATLWYNLATVNEEIGDEDNAIAMYNECLRIERQSVDAGQSTDIVDSLQRLGRLHQRRGELDEALRYFLDALTSLRTKGEKATFAAAKFLNLIGNVHLQRADIGEMIQCYSEASRIYRETASPTNEVLVIAGYFLYGLAKLHPKCAAVA